MIQVSAPVTGSLKITNNGASSYWCNIATDNVIGDAFTNSVNVLSDEGMQLYNFPLSKLDSIGGIAFSGTLSQAVDAIAALLETSGVPIQPTTPSLITDFNFNQPSSVQTSGGKVTQITDVVGNVVSSQATGAAQPTYSATGGPNGAGYATFAGAQQLTGALLTSSITFTIIALRNVRNGGNTDAELGLFQNGNSQANGYGIVDYQTWNPGSFLAGVTGGSFPDFYNWNNRWEVIVVSHSGSVTSGYNTLGVRYDSPATGDAITPTGGHLIGAFSFPGINKFVGDISRILVFNTRLSDSDVLAWTTYLSFGILKPAQLRFGGDSKMTGLGGAPACPNQTATLSQPGNYVYLKNTAVSGRTTVDVLNSLSAEVLTQYVPGIVNVYAIMIGNNDISLGLNAAQTYANIVSICTQVRAVGYKVIIMTDLYTAPLVSSANTTRNTINVNIRANWATFAEELSDTNALPNAQDPTNTTYFADGVHPTALLDTDMANLNVPLLAALL